MRTALMAMVMLAAGLAGCIGDESADRPAEPPAPAEPSPPGIAFTEAQPIPHDGRGAEPNIAIMDEGTIFVAANGASSVQPNVAQGASWLWRSMDGGRSWDTLRGPANPGGASPATPWGTGDADVVTSPDGWVYYTDWWVPNKPLISGPHGNFLVEGSPDGGETWTRNNPFAAPDEDLNDLDRQWLVAGEPGEVGLFYSDKQPERHLDVVWSADHGLTWSLPVVVVPAEEGKHYRIGHPQRTPGGVFLLPYGLTHLEEDKAKDPAEVMIAISEDSGTTWEQVDVADVPGGFDNGLAVQGAVDDAGNVYVVWAARTNETMTVFFSESADGARTWSDPVTIRARGLNFMPWAAATGDGQVALAWYGGNATGEATEAVDDAEWFAYVAERANRSAPWVVQKVDTRPVKLGPMCPSTPCQGDTRDLLDYLSLDYAPDGRLHVVFARSQSVTEDPFTTVHHIAEVS